MQRGSSMELKFEGLEIQKWNIPTIRAQGADEKNDVIYLFIMFTPRLWSWKCQKWLFFVFSADDSKKYVKVSAKI